MKNFDQSSGSTVKVEFASHFIPNVVISNKALANMYLYVDECPDEIGWLGTADYDVNTHTYTIHDTFLFRQEVHATTTEITPEGLEEFGMNLISQPNGVETWNKLRMWGHSHVRMGTSPSGQDDKQMEQFADIGHDWFIRIIGNKLGSLRVDIYNYKQGVVYLDVAWTKEVTEKQQTIDEKIAQLEALLEQQRAEKESEHKEIVEGERDVVKGEIKELVSKKTYVNYTRPGVKTVKSHSTSVKKNNHYPYSHQPQGWGGYAGYWDDWEYEGFTTGATLLGELLFEPVQILEYFVVEELEELQVYATVEELDYALHEYGYQSYFSEKDLQFIIDNISNLISKYKGA